MAINWAKKKKLDLDKCFFLCNDTNDIELCKTIGYPIGVSDCNKAIKPYLKHLTNARGGQGAIAETLEILSRLISDDTKHKSILRKTS